MPPRKRKQSKRSKSSRKSSTVKAPEKPLEVVDVGNDTDLNTITRIDTRKNTQNNNTQNNPATPNNNHNPESRNHQEMCFWCTGANRIMAPDLPEADRELLVQDLTDKRRAMHDNTKLLREASEALQLAVRRLAEPKSSKSSKSGKGAATTAANKRAEQTYRDSLEDLKSKLMSILKEDWVIRTMLAVGAIGILGWFGHRAFISSADASSELLREANQMAETIHAATRLIESISKEGAKWTFGALGAATGAANGLLLSALLQGNVPMAIASVLTSSAIGMYNGWYLTSGNSQVREDF